MTRHRRSHSALCGVTLSRASRKSVDDDYNSQHAKGAPKEKANIVNALVPKACKYGDDIKLNVATLACYRCVRQCRRISEGEVGFTFSDVIGPGHLGSEEAWQQAIGRGDVEKSIGKRGKDRYYPLREEEFVDFLDAQETHVKAVCAAIPIAAAKYLMAGHAALLSTLWVEFPANDEVVTDVPCTPEQRNHLDAASKTCQATVKIGRGLATNILSKAPDSVAIHESVTQPNATTDEPQVYVDEMDGMMYLRREDLCGAVVKQIVTAAAFSLKNVIEQEKELRAMAGLSNRLA